MEEASWIASILCIGGMIGSELFGWFSEKLGRKFAIVLATVPQLISWLLIAYGSNVTYLYVSRMLAGISSGGIFAVLPVYVSEIAEVR